MSRFTTDSTLNDLLEDPQALALLEQHIPGISTHPNIAMGRGLAFKVVAQYSGGLITDEMLSRVEAGLAVLV
jgi:hypothetical protein